MTEQRKPQPRRYSDAEAKAILMRAMAQEEERGFSRHDLELMAQELGIESTQLAIAEDAMQQQALVQADHVMLAERRQQFLAERRRKAIGTVTTLAAMIGAMALMNIFDLPFVEILGFFFFITLISNFDNAKQGISAIFGGELEDEDLEAEFDRWLERNDQRLARLNAPDAAEPPLLSDMRTLDEKLDEVIKRIGLE